MIPKLFNTENLVKHDGGLYLIKEYYATDLADYFFYDLLENLNWHNEKLFMYGRLILVPRLIAWYGDPGINYRYSKVNHITEDWTPILKRIKDELCFNLSHSFNSVLANLYRDGQDSMGCHADDEKELGENPLIASISFGESRLLRFKHKHRAIRLNILLEHGDLLIMSGQLQQHWLHELPKTRHAKEARINLTFRDIKGF